MMRLKELWKEYLEIESKVNEIDLAWQKTPGDQAIETAWLEIYETQKRTFKKLSDELIKVCDNEINERDVKILVYADRSILKRFLG